MACLAAKWLLPCVVAASVAAQQPEEHAVVRGRAVDRDGKAVEGCAVGVFAKDEAFDTAALLVRPLATTDGAGRYRVDAKRSTDQIVVVATKGCQVCVLQLKGDLAAERRVIDALMLPGGKLSGRVRDAAGKPLAGAWVRVDDPMPTSYGDEPKMSFRSGARTDERGIFEVLGVPRTGLRVTARAPGYPGVSRLGAHDTPLDLTLAPTGLVRGRVVDAGGKPVPGMAVALVTHERRDGDEQVRGDAEGRFTITAPNAFRFRVTARDGADRMFTSELLRGPADDVDVKEFDRRGDVRRITVRCVDAATRAAIEDFHASVSGGFADNIVAAVLNHPERRQPFRGEATFEVGAQQQGHTFVVVEAKGHGFATVAVPEEPVGPLVADLPAECVLTGRVVDPETGKPAGGCAVRALPDGKWHGLGFGPDPWRVGAVTDDEGRYRIGGLAPGRYWVQAYGADRPSSRSTPVTIVAGASVALDVELEAPRFLEIELAGEVPEACLGWIWLDAVNFADGKQRGTAVHRWLPLPQPVPLRGPRKLKLGPVDDRMFVAKLLVPTRDRLSSALTISLGVVDGDGATLQLPDLRTVVRRGRVLLPADVLPERVAVVANRRFGEGEGDRWSRAMSSRDRAFAACLGSDARFTLDVPHGRYILQLVDLETGIVFHTDGEERTLDAGTADRTIEIAPAIRWLTIDLVPEVKGGPVLVQGIEVTADRPDDGLRAFVGSAGGTNLYQDMVVPCAPAMPQLRWLVPAAGLTLEAVQAFGVLSPNPNYKRNVVATASIDAGEREQHVTFRIPPPPDSVR